MQITTLITFSFSKKIFTKLWEYNIMKHNFILDHISVTYYVTNQNGHTSWKKNFLLLLTKSFCCWSPCRLDDHDCYKLYRLTTVVIAFRDILIFNQSKNQGKNWKVREFLGCCLRYICYFNYNLKEILNYGSVMDFYRLIVNK